jgi:AcrR family transcriptional regulator
MRKRLLVATLQSLAEDGYNGATLSSIVRRAGVSRGAQVHHYPNKQALMLDAADDMFRRTYRTLGELMLSIVEENNRLQALVNAVWEQVFATPLYRAYMELLIASQRDTAMRQALEALLARQIRVFEIAIDPYFEPAPGAEQDIRPLFIQLYFMLTGLASHAHLFPRSESVQPHLHRWVKQTAAHMRARKGVRSPPPRPESWAAQHQ